VLTLRDTPRRAQLSRSGQRRPHCRPRDGRYRPGRAEVPMRVPRVRPLRVAVHGVERRVQRVGEDARWWIVIGEPVNRFAGYVAHDLRTPLATQRALLELVLADPNTDAATWREIGEDV